MEESLLLICVFDADWAHADLEVDKGVLEHGIDCVFIVVEVVFVMQGELNPEGINLV